MRGSAVARCGRRPATIAATTIAILATALSGCLYPGDPQRAENPAAVREGVAAVQRAVDEYRRATGVLPIRNRPVNTPIYEKYPIDFSRLVEGGFLGAIPKVAFEKGGRAVFVLVDVETAPKVKLLDLPTHEAAVRVRQAVEAHLAEGRPLPAGEQVAPQFWTVDFAAMGMREERIVSVFSGLPLRWIVHESGAVGIDYAADIMSLIQRLGLTDADIPGDLRELLVRESDFVPVDSFAYRWIDRTPVPVFP
ncbi:MAG: hypothetical protein BLM47_08090 [Candidatus Reconcilbacillus cellulovorans]|uniref:Uncharacterized protein n=1 Tax=Candidatus Reconcilbacillus cellulovorans TaxID=1906605 RepID=A0A2A6E038_9BACL|nr:MAG: hypothetical protein BLM47_08090 [Candidatus Reconcilbacillus cellulovorans]